jgi:hypothetical protein
MGIGGRGEAHLILKPGQAVGSGRELVATT